MLPTYSFPADATYLITGGLGGLGRSIAQWMAQRGARNLILLSRSTTRSAAALRTINGLRAQGVNVTAPPCDIGDKDALAATLAHCARDMPPVRGCIQGSMVLQVFDLTSRVR